MKQCTCGSTKNLREVKDVNDNVTSYLCKDCIGDIYKRAIVKKNKYWRNYKNFGGYPERTKTGQR